MSGFEGFAVLLLAGILLVFFNAGIKGYRDERQNGNQGKAAFVLVANALLFGIPALGLLTVGYEAILSSLLLAVVVGGFLMLMYKFGG